MNIPTTYGGAILLSCKEKYALVSELVVDRWLTGKDFTSMNYE